MDVDWKLFRSFAAIYVNTVRVGLRTSQFIPAINVREHDVG